MHTSGASSCAQSRAGAAGSRAHSALSAMFMRAPGSQRASSGLDAACSILRSCALSGPPPSHYTDLPIKLHVKLFSRQSVVAWLPIRHCRA